jgi:hypothetical protein
VEPGRTYRTRLSLRLAVVAAAILWAAGAVALAKLPGANGASVAGAAAMSAFFVATAVGYQRSAIRVTPRGLEALGPLHRRAVPFEDVLQVVVRDGPAGRAYAILTRRGTVRFTCLFARHRELLETILDGAALEPLAL